MNVFEKLSRKATLISLIGIIFMVFGTVFHSGVKEGYIYYFILPAIFCPLMILSLSNDRFIKDLTYTFVLIGLFWLSAELFWSYKDRPWFSPEPTTEGRYGWFSFENRLKSWVFPVFGGIAIVIGSLIKFLTKSKARNAD